MTHMTSNDPDNHSSVIPHLELNILECEVKWAYRKHYFWAKLVQVTGESNGTPLQYSCLENPMDGGAW